MSVHVCTCACVCALVRKASALWEADFTLTLSDKHSCVTICSWAHILMLATHAMTNTKCSIMQMGTQSHASISQYTHTDREPDLVAPHSVAANSFRSQYNGLTVIFAILIRPVYCHIHLLPYSHLSTFYTQTVNLPPATP